MWLFLFINFLFFIFIINEMDILKKFTWKCLFILWIVTPISLQHFNVLYLCGYWEIKQNFSEKKAFHLYLRLTFSLKFDWIITNVNVFILYTLLMQQLINAIRCMSFSSIGRWQTGVMWSTNYLFCFVCWYNVLYCIVVKKK